MRTFHQGIGESVGGKIAIRCMKSDLESLEFVQGLVGDGGQSGRRVRFLDLDTHAGDSRQSGCAIIAHRDGHTVDSRSLVFRWFPADLSGLGIDAQACGNASLKGECESLSWLIGIGG